MGPIVARTIKRGVDVINAKTLLVVLILVLTLSTSAVAEEVTLYRDTWGVPHVYAETATAGAFGLGYAQAEDRLSDIYLGVRTGMGTLSEVLGEKFIEHDYLMRLCRNEEIARQSWESQTEHLRAGFGEFRQWNQDVRTGASGTRAPARRIT